MKMCSDVHVGTLHMIMYQMFFIGWGQRTGKCVQMFIRVWDISHENVPRCSYWGGGGDTVQISKIKTNVIGRVGGWFAGWLGGWYTLKKIMPLRCFILKAGTCQILSLAE